MPSEQHKLPLAYRVYSGLPLFFAYWVAIGVFVYAYITGEIPWPPSALKKGWLFAGLAVLFGVLNFFCGWAHSTAQRRTPPRNVSSVFGPGSLLGILAVLLVLKSFSWKLVALPAAVVFDFGSWNAGRRIRDFLYRLS